MDKRNYLLKRVCNGPAFGELKLLFEPGRAERHSGRRVHFRTLSH
jgi:hypothetical protein